MARILFVGGGSIGHIAPSVAVAHALKRIAPDTRVLFVCGPREEEKQFLSAEGWEPHILHAPRFSCSFPLRFPRVYLQAHRLLKELKPDGIFSKGGYISVPLCLAAHRRRIPIVLHESDVVNGYANRLVARWAHHVCLGFPMATRGDARRTFTGNPLRPAVTQGSTEEGLRLAKFTNRSRPVLLVMGGSQGSLALNRYVAEHAAELLSVFDILHVTGQGKTGIEPKPDGYWPTPFAQKEMPHLYATADIALSRAGMNTITELAANKIPTVLMPLRGVAHDHQEKNARAIETMGGCIVVEESDADAQLFSILTHLWDNLPRRRALIESSRHLWVPDAAVQIAHIIMESLA
ncbi:hypothetical protein COU80_00995 [Candidatus Peregrinibacteria bacterium CG10_big_fil_rev_8_21_14_0_10_55_24]|nr:MAG: hypothetical protein COU80_00995 [Candidatus Peregrinibacteria bacterium CG10_big_fil_rev_8_21_14_0_10_55_24]